MKDQVAEAVSKGKRFLPELGVAERRSQLAHAGRVFRVVVGKNRCECGVKVTHISYPQRQSKKYPKPSTLAKTFPLFCIAELPCRRYIFPDKARETSLPGTVNGSVCLPTLTFTFVLVDC